jgi:hypothetical protein
MQDAAVRVADVVPDIAHTVQNAWSDATSCWTRWCECTCRNITIAAVAALLICGGIAAGVAVSQVRRLQGAQRTAHSAQRSGC